LLLAIALSAFGISSLSSISANKFTPGQHYTPFRNFTASLLCIYALFSLIGILQQVYITELMILAEHQSEVTLTEIWTAIKRDWKTIAVTYLTIIPVGIIIVLLAVLSFLAVEALGTALGGFIFLVFYLGLIYAIIPLSNLLFIRLRERKGIIETFVQAFKITRGNWWKTFIGLFVTLLVIYSLVIVAAIPMYIQLVITIMHGVKGANPFAGTEMGIYMTLISCWTFVVYNVMNVFIGTSYYSLSEKHDHLHLREEISKIGEREDSAVRKQEGYY
jgi:hypothetical protein